MGMNALLSWLWFWIQTRGRQKWLQVPLVYCAPLKTLASHRHVCGQASVGTPTCFHSLYKLGIRHKSLHDIVLSCWWKQIREYGHKYLSGIYRSSEDFVVDRIGPLLKSATRVYDLTQEVPLKEAMVVLMLQFRCCHSCCSHWCALRCSFQRFALNILIRSVVMHCLLYPAVTRFIKRESADLNTVKKPKFCWGAWQKNGMQSNYLSTRSSQSLQARLKVNGVRHQMLLQ